MSVGLRLHEDQISLKDNELRFFNTIMHSCHPYLQYYQGLAEKLKSKHCVFLSRNHEEIDLIRAIIPPVETETDRIDISTSGFIDVILIITNRRLLPKSQNV